MTKRKDIGRLQDELEELFSELWRGPRFGGQRRGFRPRVDIFRTDAGSDGTPAELTIVAELAGVDPAHVDVVLFDRTLVIAGRREGAHPVCRPSYYQLEIENGHFERRLALSENVNAEEACATFDRGLLTVVLPIAERPREDVKVIIAIRGAR